MNDSGTPREATNRPNVVVPFPKIQQYESQAVEPRWYADVLLSYTPNAEFRSMTSWAVREAVGRLCMIQAVEKGTGFAFPLEGEFEWDARRDAQEVINHVLARLKLSRGTVEAIHLFRVPGPPEDSSEPASVYYLSIAPSSE